MWTLFWQWDNSSRHRIQIDIRCHGQKRFLVQDGDRFETSFEKRPRTSILLIRKSSKWFFEALLELTKRRQTTSSLTHPIGVVQFSASSQSIRNSKCRWLSMVLKPPTDIAKISLSSFSRWSIHLFRWKPFSSES
jgi:hypothetical protein